MISGYIKGFWIYFGRVAVSPNREPKDLSLEGGLPLFIEEGLVTGLEQLFPTSSSRDTCPDIKKAVIAMFHRSWV